MTQSCCITFPTTYFAIRAESLLKSKDYTYKMIPVPRVISSSCGTALRCNCEDITQIRSFLLAEALQLDGFYRLEETGLQTPAVEELHYDQ